MLLPFKFNPDYGAGEDGFAVPTRTIDCIDPTDRS